MWWADIEVPNGLVDKDSQKPSACYPRRTFYSLSDDLSTQNHRITMTDLSIPARFVNLTVKQIYAITLSNKYLFEFAFVHLRYSLGGDRPSQTTFHKLSKNLVISKV